MTTTESILKTVAEISEKRKTHPIYQIMLLAETGEEEEIYDNGTHSGFPKTGMLDYPGFYYELETAIQAMNENWCDMRETIFDAGFILVHYPGLYDCAGTDHRMYFKWDEEKQGYFQAEEPPLFAHSAY